MFDVRGGGMVVKVRRLEFELRGVGLIFVDEFLDGVG